MKKKSGSRIGRVLSRIINIRVWLDWDRMKSFARYLKQSFKQAFIPRKAKKNESFNAAVSHLNLTAADLKIKQNSLYRLSIIMTVAASLIFVYAGYHLFYGTFRAFSVSLVITMIALVLAFRYHFWYFQIKSRKLGCTFQEWFRQGLLGGKE